MERVVSGCLFLIHLGVVLFMVLIPFLNVPWPWRLLYFTAGCSLMLHWALNNNTCALSLFEAWWTNVPVTESFMHRLVSPIYTIEDATLQTLVWIALPLLMVLNAWRWYTGY